MTTPEEIQRRALQRKADRDDRDPPQLIRGKIRHADIKGPREAELILLAKGGDRRAAGTLVEAHDALVYMTVRRYFGHGVDSEEVMQEGRLGLLHAVEKFDPDRGTAFGSYAVYWIRHYAAKYVSEHCSDIRVAAKVRAAYGQKIRKNKSVAELTSSPRAVDRALAEHLLAVIPPARLDAQTSHWQTGDSFGSLADKLTADAPPPDEMLDRARLEAALAAILPRAVQALPARMREIVSRRYPLDASEPESLEQIGVSVGLSRERIRQIEVMALDLIVRRLSEREFAALSGG